MKPTALSILLSLSMPLLAESQDGPDPSQLSISNIQYQGSGCPAGTATVDLSDDLEAFTIVFSEFIATSDSNEEKDRQCLLDFTFDSTDNFEFAVVNMQFRGAIYLSEGARATQKLRVKLNGQKEKFGAVEINGYIDDFYERIGSDPYGFH